MGYSFAIIGGGLTATSFLVQLVDKLIAQGDTGRRLCRGLSIAVFERGQLFGPGMPHSAENVLDCHITNMCAKDMSVRSERRDDFHRWLHDRAMDLKDSGLPDPATDASYTFFKECLHYPRGIMGEYLQNRFSLAVEGARKLGISVTLYPQCEVVELTPQRSGFLLRVANDGRRERASHAACRVLLATGHWSEASRYEHYYPSPWPAQRLLEGIPPSANVGIIGSSLSAIEVALTLSAEGVFVRNPDGKLCYRGSDNRRRMTFYSRNGLLPGVRGRIGKRQNRFLTCERILELVDNKPGAVTLSSLFSLLNRELHEAYGYTPEWRQLLCGSGDPMQRLGQQIDQAKQGDGPAGELLWQTILTEIFPVVRLLYLNLRLDEREQFDRNFSTMFFMHAATQPIINAEKLLALMECGMVRLVRLGNDYRFDYHLHDNTFEFTYTGEGGESKKESCHYVVNAAGQPRSIDTDPSPLIQKLRKQGLVQTFERQIRNEHTFSYETGSIIVDPDTHRVIQPGSEEPDPDRDFFAVGAMTRGQMIDASMAEGLATSTAAIVDLFIAKLFEQTHNLM